jgi:hypothetical protein
VALVDIGYCNLQKECAGKQRKILIFNSHYSNFAYSVLYNVLAIRKKAYSFTPKPPDRGMDSTRNYHILDEESAGKMELCRELPNSG